MKRPKHIAERIEEVLAATSPEGWHIDNEARRHGGIALMGTIGSVWLLRPDGSLWEVDEDSGKPLQALPEELHVTALVYGVERHPWLRELLPARPQEADDCQPCEGRGMLGQVACPGCQGLGWRLDP